MSLPTKLTQNYSLKYLDTDQRLATVYTAFLVPKTQQDAIRLIYNIPKEEGRRAPIINRPVKQISDTRKKLMEAGLLIRHLV